MVYDIAVIGAGPAGLAAAINARRRNKQTVLIGKEESSSKLIQAHQIDNYPGLPKIGGAVLAKAMLDQAKDNGVMIVKDEIQSIDGKAAEYDLYGREQAFRALSVILATGINLGAEIEGESGLAGKGVSYCATCDGMFFKSKPVALIGYIREAETEAGFLAEICSRVYYLPLYPGVGALDSRITVIAGKPLLISGVERVESLRTTAGNWEVAGVFIERAGRPAGQIINGLQIENGFVKTDLNQATNIFGVFAAGDCTGKPWQIARAVGQGQVAALTAVQYLESIEKR